MTILDIYRANKKYALMDAAARMDFYIEDNNITAETIPRKDKKELFDFMKYIEYNDPDTLMDYLSERNEPPESIRLYRELEIAKRAEYYKANLPVQVTEQVDFLSEEIWKRDGIKEIIYKENDIARRIAIGCENSVDEIRVFLYENMLLTRDKASIKVIYGDPDNRKKENYIICSIAGEQ